jgi:hypothetical protein
MEFESEIPPSGNPDSDKKQHALAAIARQYQTYAIENELVTKNSEARLLVSAVKPGSIDINLVPDLVSTVAMAGPLLAPLIDKLELIEKFGKHLKSLIDLFAKKREATAGDNISVNGLTPTITTRALTGTLSYKPYSCILRLHTHRRR